MLIGFLLFCMVGLWAVIASKLKKEDNNWYRFAVFCMFFNVAILFVSVFLTVSQKESEGKPAYEIPDVGTYKVGYIYVAGPNVNFGIEAKGANHEYIRHYQLPASIFEEIIPHDPAMLVVTETDNMAGKIKHLRLIHAESVPPAVVGLPNR
jgi:hypothetical protein